MAIEGPLRELGIHDVFQLLDLSRKTGRLRVSSALRDNEGTVFFRGGRVVGATIRSNPHPLGTLLLRAGKVSESDLERARAAQQAGSTRRLGELLVEAGALNARELRRYVMQQIEVVVFELLSWQEGFFSFIEQDGVDLPGDDGIEVSTESLLMEGARRLDEWAQISERIPHLGLVPVLADLPVDGPAPRLALLPNEWEVLAAMDGERDLRAIATTLNRSEFDVGRIAFGLVVTGVISCVEAVDVPLAVGSAASIAHVLVDARDALGANHLEDAASHAAAAVALDPDHVEARWLMARVLLRQGRDAEAITAAREVLQRDPDHTGALMELARHQARRGDLGGAVELWERVASRAPSSSAAAQARGALEHARSLVAVLEVAHG